MTQRTKMHQMASRQVNATSPVNAYATAAVNIDAHIERIRRGQAKLAGGDCTQATWADAEVMQRIEAQLEILADMYGAEPDAIDLRD